LYIKNLYRFVANKPFKLILLGLLLLVFYYFCLPKQMFKDPKSTLIESKEGLLLGAKIAADGQWRFPKSHPISNKFKHCILQFEDAYFYKHFGFNPVSMAKAISSNLQEQAAKRGASTITQQVIRLSRKGKPRTYFEKLKELILATMLEFRFSKEEILMLYVSNALFGGNVVGIEAASWRYYGRSSEQLSWAENATLAVLPNAPSLIYPGKNQAILMRKRNRLLQKLYSKSIIDSLSYSLAIQEKLPRKPHALPSSSSHLLEHLTQTNSEQYIQTSISFQLQKKCK